LLTDVPPPDAKARFLNPRALVAPREHNARISPHVEEAILWGMEMHPDRGRRRLLIFAWCCWACSRVRVRRGANSFTVGGGIGAESCSDVAGVDFTDSGVIGYGDMKQGAMFAMRCRRRAGAGRPYRRRQPALPLQAVDVAIPRSQNSLGYDDEIRLQAVTLFKEGYSLRTVGRILQVNHQTVANWVQAAEDLADLDLPTSVSELAEWDGYLD
jgi:hypothetical protein